MPDPRVTVLMPVRDAAPTLEAAMASLQRQTLPDFEVIAVDDHSCDSCPEILESWAERDSRVRVLSSAGQGLVAALEHGRREVKTDLLARMDADDVAHPERLRLQVEHLAGRSDLAGTGCLVRMFPRNRLRSGWLRYERWVNRLVNHEEIRAERFVESPLVHPSVTLRSGVLEQVGGYRPSEWPEDHDLWLRLLAAGYRLDKIPRTLLFWRESRDRLTHVSPRYHPESFRQMKLFHLLRGPLATRRRVALWGAGKNGRRWARLLTKKRVQVEFFIDVDAAKIGHRILDIPVESPERVLGPRLPFVLGAVAAEGARPLIRAALHRAGKIEERDFLFVQ